MANPIAREDAMEGLGPGVSEGDGPAGNTSRSGAGTSVCGSAAWPVAPCGGSEASVGAPSIVQEIGGGGTRAAGYTWSPACSSRSLSMIKGCCESRTMVEMPAGSMVSRVAMVSAVLRHSGQVNSSIAVAVCLLYSRIHSVWITQPHIIAMVSSPVSRGCWHNAQSTTEDMAVWPRSAPYLERCCKGVCEAMCAQQVTACMSHPHTLASGLPLKPHASAT